MGKANEGRSRRVLDAAKGRYADGGTAAFGIAYDAVTPRIHRCAFGMLSDAFHAEDVVQNTRLRIHQANGQFIPGREGMPSAYTIAWPLAPDILRRRRRERQWPPGTLVHEDAPSSDARLHEPFSEFPAGH